MNREPVNLRRHWWTVPAGVVGIVAVLLFLARPQGAVGAETRIQPAVTLSEEYNDNVFLAPEKGETDYISKVAPSLSFLHRAAYWDWDAVYTYNYRYYAKRTIGSDRTHSLSLTNKNRIVGDVLYLDLADAYTRVSLDTVRDFTQDSNFVRQSDRNIFTANPYLALSLSSSFTITTGYVYQNTWYKDPVAIDRTDRTGYADLRQDLTPRLFISAGVRQLLDENRTESYRQNDLYLGQNYEFMDNSAMMLKGGSTWFSFDQAGRTTQLFWDALFQLRYPAVFASLETGIRYIPDPLFLLRREDRYVATIGKKIERTSLTFSGGLREYREAETKDLETASYRLDGRASHAFTMNAKIIFDLSLERLKDYLAESDKTGYRGGVRLERLAMENLTLALDYRYANYSSPTDFNANYENNRVLVEIRKVF